MVHFYLKNLQIISGIFVFIEVSIQMGQIFMYICLLFIIFYILCLCYNGFWLNVCLVFFFLNLIHKKTTITQILHLIMRRLVIKIIDI